jgi:uncharacterized spore protein YtfJ
MPSAFAKLGAIKDVMAVRRVFGEAYKLDGVDVIPVASIRGGGGAGGGSTESNDPMSGPAGTGAGMGFGVDARPVGIVVVKNGEATWQPTIDVTKIVLNGQQVALSAIVAFFALVVFRRLRHRK